MATFKLCKSQPQIESLIYAVCAVLCSKQVTHLDDISMDFILNGRLHFEKRCMPETNNRITKFNSNSTTILNVHYAQCTAHIHTQQFHLFLSYKIAFQTIFLFVIKHVPILAKKPSIVSLENCLTTFLTKYSEKETSCVFVVVLSKSHCASNLSNTKAKIHVRLHRLVVNYKII